MEKEELQLHRWWFEIGHTDVYYYDKNKRNLFLWMKRLLKNPEGS